MIEARINITSTERVFARKIIDEYLPQILDIPVDQLQMNEVFLKAVILNRLSENGNVSLKDFKERLNIAPGSDGDMVCDAAFSEIKTMFIPDEFRPSDYYSNRLL